MEKYIIGEFALVQLTFGSCTSPTDTFPLTYHPFNCLDVCAVDNFQRLRFGNSRSPDNVKHKSMFMFSFTFHTIYGVNGTDQYTERCSPNTDNDAILTTLLHYQEDNFSKLTDKNRSKIDRNKYVPNKW